MGWIGRSKEEEKKVKIQNIYKENSNLGGRRSSQDRRVSADSNYKGIERRISGDRRKEAGRRIYKRFQAKDLTFVKLNSEYEEDLGQLLDISKGGLSLRYFKDEERSRSYTDLGIFMSGGDFAVDWIPFKGVADTVLKNNSLFNTILLRRYAVQFEDLTPDQAAKLDYFLLNHTLGQA